MPVVLLLALLSPQVLAGDDPATCKYCPDYSGWSGWIEGGIGTQSDDDYRFGRYSGYEEEGGLFNASGELRYRGRDGTFLEGVAEDLGIESRRIRIEGGRQGRYEVGIEYDQLPNFRERNTLTPFRDEGDGKLALPGDWVPSSTTSGMSGLSGDLLNTPLQTERERAGASFSFHPARRWEISGFARHEEKEGVKDLGATFEFSQAAILPVPFKYTTDEFGLNLGYSGKRFQSRLSYSASLFKNDQEAVVWDNPFVDPASPTGQGRMAEAPDNQLHQLGLILGYQLTDSTRIGARLSRGILTQDQDYLPYTINPTLGADLPAANLNGEVNTTLASVELNARPLPRLRLDASYTYSDRDNQSGTNVYHYVSTDLSQLPDAQRRNRPYSYKQNLLRLKAAYRFPKRVTLSLGYDDDSMERTYTSVEETQDATLWAKLKLRPFSSLEASLKVSHAERDASDFTPLSEIDSLLDNPDANYVNNPLMRAHNMADRSRDKIGFGLAYTPIDRLSIGLDLDSFEDDYEEMVLGLRKAEGLTYTLSLSYTLSEHLSGSAFYSSDELSSDQRGSEKFIVDDPDSFWVAADENLTETLGLGINWAAIPKKLDLGAELAYAEYTGKIEFAGSQALPEIDAKLTSINLHGTYRFSERLSLRADLRYEAYEENDWSRNGLVDGLTELISLGAEERDTATSLGMFSLRYSF
jgi:MtrB/PioB family decaheme-associated outer membrane protein